MLHDLWQVGCVLPRCAVLCIVWGGYVVTSGICSATSFLLDPTPWLRAPSPPGAIWTIRTENDEASWLALVR